MSRPLFSRSFPFVLCLALALPGVASAAEVVLAPLVPRGASNQQVANITSLIASELDFSSSVDKVIEIDKTPAGLNVACLSSASCLAKIGRDAGGDHVMTGSLRMTQTQVVLDLVYYDISRGRFVRRLSFELPNESEVIADNMDDIVRELLTGEAPNKQQAADADAMADDFVMSDDDEDDDINFDADDFALAAVDETKRKAEADVAGRRAAAQREVREAEAAERKRREDEVAERERRAAAEAESRRLAIEKAERERREAAEAERSRVAEAAAERERREEAAAEGRREEAAAERRRAALVEVEPDEPDDDEGFDPNAFSFGGGFGGGDIIVEGADTPTEEKSEPKARTRTASATTYYDDDLDDEGVDEPGGIMMLDDEPEDLDGLDRVRTEKVRTEKVKPERTANSRTRTPSSSSFNGDDTVVQIAVRGGFSPYYALGFITTGGEISVALGETGVHIIGGVEAWSVNRDIPEQFQAQAQAVTEWNFLVPINLGATYRLDLADGRVRPYFGADLVFARYYVPEDGGGRVSAGPRARAGADLMVVRNFGFNVNVAMGFWSGKDWVIIEKDVQNSGLLPQVSAGTVFAF
ncbi:MAG: hypothetical protein ACI9MC_000369 [Kiritimatiellia bacterium]